MIDLKAIHAEIQKGIEEARKHGVKCGDVQNIFISPPTQKPAKQCTDN